MLASPFRRFCISSLGIIVLLMGQAFGGYETEIKPFFETHCISCHGQEKSKGKLTLHTLDGDLSEGHDLERWEVILEMLESGEMPPEDEPQPDDVERHAVAKWIEAGMREYVALGDNTGNSLDSRYWGTVKEFNLVGPAMFALWPVTTGHWGFIR